jgi:hypothetical protein
MTRAAYLSLAIAAIPLSGCAPVHLLPAPEGWPREIEGRKLYPTQQALVYAPSACSAGWADRYLQERIPRIQKQFGVPIARGAIFVIRPADQPIAGVERWPPWPVKDLMLIYPRIAARERVLPEPTWTCALPTDDFYNAAVDHYHAQVIAASLRDHFDPGSWLFMLLFPLQRKDYLMESYVLREQALATAAIESVTGQESNEVLDKVLEYYDHELHTVSKRYGFQE